MKKIFLLASAASLLFAGCMKNEIDAPETIVTDAPETILATFGEITKAHLDGLDVIWNTSDEISLFAKTNAHNKYVLDVLDADNSSSASFKFDQEYSAATETLEKNYAVFPYRPADNKVTADGIVTTRIKNNQDYRQGKLLMCAPMVAVADGYDFEFQNVASVLRFNVKTSADYTDVCTLKTIKIASASKVLSGLITVDTNADEFTATPIETSKNVKLQDGQINVKLTTEPQPFCLVIPPGTYPAGDLTITMTLNDTYEDFQKVIVYDNELTVGANKLQDINCTVRPEVVEDDFGVEVTTGGIYEFNGHPHLTCYTASVTGGVAVTADDVAVTELGVLFQRAGKEENMVIGNVGTGTNDVRQVKASSVSENAVLKLNNLVGGSDGATLYAYRFYAVLDDGNVAYGQTKEFRTDTYCFVPVKAGTFTMGADSGQPGENTGSTGKTTPAHQVSLTTDFEISKYELAVPQFAAFLNAKGVVPATNTASELTAKIDNKIVYSGKKTDNGEKMSIAYEDGKWDGTPRKKYPVERITKYGVELYCQWLTETENDGYTYRLPTEAEWEWAAMGGIHSQGYKYSGSNNLNDVGVPKNNSNTNVQQTTAVLGTKYPNELGIYDMSGNLWEVVSDRSDYNWLDSSGTDASYFAFCHGKGTVTDPQGPVAADGYTFESDKYYCIRKGGSVNDSSTGQNFCPHYRRLEGIEKTTHRNDTGFRIVRVPKAN